MSTKINNSEKWNKFEEDLLLELIQSKEDWEIISIKLDKSIAACKQKVKRIRVSRKKQSILDTRVTVTISYEDNTYTFKVKESEIKDFIIKHI